MIQEVLLPLVNKLQSAVEGDLFWESYLSALPEQAVLPFTLHLGIFIEPYLQFILEGKKTIESRFASRRFAPYNQVKQGDILLLKQSSGPIVGICQVTHCWFYQLNSESLETIQRDFAEALCAQDQEFWQQRQAACYATLMRINFVKAIEPIPFPKRDRRGWVVLQSYDRQLELNI
jgi:ASC-1-like (ASCH) protein